MEREAMWRGGSFDQAPQRGVGAPRIRPPRALREGFFVVVCDGCGDCIEACETGALVPDDDGRPLLDFRAGACTFCGACADVCDAGAFGFDLSRDWTVVARVSERCIARAGHPCTACRGSCPEAALRHLRNGESHMVPEVDADLCTGCGECVARCPLGAIRAETTTPAAAVPVIRAG